MKKQKIKLYKKAPKCLKCNVPMKWEQKTFTDKQEKMINCEHDWVQIDDDAKEKSSIIHFECLKCPDTLAKQVTFAYDDEGNKRDVDYEILGHVHVPTADLYRCPKCLDLYKVEEAD